MPLTAAERAKRYRERIKNDPSKLTDYKKKKHDQYLKTKIPIKDQDERQQRLTRRRWKVNQKNRRRIKNEEAVIMVTPPNSPPQAGCSTDDGTRKIKKIRKRYQRKLDTAKEQIKLLQIKLKSAQKANQRLKKRHIENGPITPRKKAELQLNGSPKKLKKTLVFHNTLVAELKRKMQEARGSKEKNILSKIVAGNILKRYKMQKRSQDEIGVLRISKRREIRKRKYSIQNMEKKVIDFYLEEVNSTTAPGKKETITKNKVKKQKKYLTDSLKNIHKKFVRGGMKISYDAFRKLKPFWVVKRSHRDTCACKRCSNIKFKIQSLHQIGEIKTTNENELMNVVVCSTDSYSCMFRQCNICNDKMLEYTESNDENTEVSWYEWCTRDERRSKQGQDGIEKVYTVKVTVKEKRTGTLKSLKEQFHKCFHEHIQHKFNISHQYDEMKKIKENIKENEIALVIDFSENYACKIENEVQAHHFGASRKQATLHTGVVYTKESTQAFCSIAENPRHDPPAIFAHLHPVLSEFGTGKDIIHFMSDSPNTQYRCAKNLYLFHNVIHSYEFERATWNYSESGHGKSAADGVGGVLKRTADDIVKYGKDIPNAETLFKTLKKETNVKLFYINDEDISHFDRMTPNRLPTVKGSMKIHQLISTKERLMCRSHSCFCNEVE